jgi:hypothetical protein
MQPAPGRLKTQWRPEPSADLLVSRCYRSLEVALPLRRNVAVNRPVPFPEALVSFPATDLCETSLALYLSPPPAATCHLPALLQVAIATSWTSIAIAPMAPSRHPVRDMMEALHMHYDVRWSDTQSDLMGHLYEDRILAFLSCHHASHAPCSGSREVVTLTCWDAVIWSSVLAYFHYALPTAPGARQQFCQQWTQSRFFRAIVIAINHHNEPDLTALFRPFVAVDTSRHPHFFDYPVTVLRNTPPDYLPPAPHAFAIDAVLVFETWECEEAKDWNLPLRQHIVVRELLDNMTHVGLMARPDASAWQSDIIGLHSGPMAGITMQPLSWMRRFQAKNAGHAGVLGRLVELDMGPAAIVRYQNFQ